MRPSFFHLRSECALLFGGAASAASMYQGTVYRAHRAFNNFSRIVRDRAGASFPPIRAYMGFKFCLRVCVRLKRNCLGTTGVFSFRLVARVCVRLERSLLLGFNYLGLRPSYGFASVSNAGIAYALGYTPTYGFASVSNAVHRAACAQGLRPYHGFASVSNAGHCTCSRLHACLRFCVRLKRSTKRCTCKWLQAGLRFCVRLKRSEVLLLLFPSACGLGGARLCKPALCVRRGAGSTYTIQLSSEAVSFLPRT